MYKRQVMDSDGNVFYTRAGNLQLDYKSGNLVDANGYTVLGVTGDPLGKAAGSDKIHLSVPSKNNAQSSSCLLYTSQQGLALPGGPRETITGMWIIL